MKEIIEKYDQEISKYQKLNAKIVNLIKVLLSAHKDIRIHNIVFRVKDKDSLNDKLQKKKKYEKLEDVTDLSGVRIICYFEDDVDKVSRIIEEEFDIDQLNSVDKRQLKTNEFGYKSQHLVVKFKGSRISLSEYSACQDLLTEIQIRTILQHGWAEIEHDLGYKSSIAVPKEYRRDFNRVAALLETADKEFSHLKSKIDNYESELPKRFEENLDQIGIDKFSVKFFLESNELLREIENEMASIWEVPYKNLSEYKHVGELLYVLKELDIENIGQLIDTIKSKRKEILQKERKQKSKTLNQQLTGLSTGTLLFHLWFDKLDRDNKNVT